MATKNGYSVLQIALHWIIAVLIVTAWLISDGMGEALRARLQTGATGTEGNTAHVWLGGATFLLILIRLIVRWVQGAPDPVAGGSEMMEKAGIWGHRLLYLLMIVTPALGAITWYGGVRATGDLHEVASNALLIVAAGHAAMAIIHQYVLRDGSLDRMTRQGG